MAGPKNLCPRPAASTTAPSSRMRCLSPFSAKRILNLASTGGGHSLISGHYGLAADTNLELKLVTPAGDIVALNQGTNTISLLLAYSIPRFRPAGVNDTSMAKSSRTLKYDEP